MFSIHALLFVFLFGFDGSLGDFQNILPKSPIGTPDAIQLEVAVLLEGPLKPDGAMHTKLYDRGYLPGQKPKTFFGKSSVAGQPYDRIPWNYQGKEGTAIKKQSFDYPSNTVDWVLVTLLSDNEALRPVCRVSGILLNDGTISFPSTEKPCEVDVTQSYFVVIEHRNHIGVISHLPVRPDHGRITYDFRELGDFDAQTTGLKINQSGYKLMVAGNGDQTSSESTSFSIDENDLKMWRSQNGQNSNYLNMDLDLSGDVSIKDQELLFTNYGITSSVAIPK